MGSDKTELISFLVSEQDKQKILEVAERERLSLSSFVRNRVLNSIIEVKK